LRPREPRLYLQDIEVAISRILEFTSGGPAEFFESALVHDAVVRQFEIIGEAVRNLPEEMLADEPEISWKRAVRMRDRLAHGYFSVDLGIVWDTIENDLPQLRAAVRRLLQDLDADDT
jgi:uncharacterized protein with HEPN domain